MLELQKVLLQLTKKNLLQGDVPSQRCKYILNTVQRKLIWMKVIHVLNITCYKRSNKESVIHIGQILVKSDIIKLRMIMKTLFITHNQKLIITTSTKKHLVLAFSFCN